jgi:hypothetical protein
MSFIGDLVKKIPGVSDIGGFVGDLSDAYKENKDWLNPVISGGQATFKGYPRIRAGVSTQNLLRDSLQRDYDSQSANQKAYLEYIGQANAARGAAASAAAAAANATDKNRRKALSKAQKKLQQGYCGCEELSRSLRSNGHKVTSSSGGYVWKRSWEYKRTTSVLHEPCNPRKDKHSNKYLHN